MKPARLLPNADADYLATDDNAAFLPGGQAVQYEASSMGADVGATESLADRIQFE